MLRRAFIRLRQSAEDFYGQIRSDFAPMPSLELMSFSTADDISRFRVTTDRVLGGASDCSFALKAYRHFSVGSFTGVIDWQADGPSDRDRGGFASFRTRPDERIRDVSAFAAFQLRIKTDGRPYIANFKCADHSPDQLWQVRLHAPPLQWVTVAFPFSDLIFTKRGHIEENQIGLNCEALNGFGILLADGSNGPFRFEIQSLSVLRSFDPMQWSTAPEAIAGGLAQGALAPSENNLSGPPVGASRDKIIAFHEAQRRAAKRED